MKNAVAQGLVSKSLTIQKFCFIISAHLKRKYNFNLSDADKIQSCI